MTAPAHYPYSTTYLATHIQRISRGIVVGGITLAAIVLILAVIFN